MNTFSVGKIAGAAVLLFGLGMASCSQEEAPDAAPAPNPAPATDPTPTTNPSSSMPTSDASAGERLFRRCMSCHTTEDGGPDRVGPNLWGVVGREIGSVDGFRYSRPMAASTDTWTLENLNSFIENPRGFLPGTNMSFAGLRKQEDRDNVIAYLRTLTGDASTDSSDN